MPSSALNQHNAGNQGHDPCSAGEEAPAQRALSQHGERGLHTQLLTPESLS